MKTFFIILLSCIIIICGLVSHYLYIYLSGFHWYHVILLIGSWLVICPAMYFYINYFKNLLILTSILLTSCITVTEIPEFRYEVMIKHKNGALDTLYYSTPYESCFVLYKDNLLHHYDIISEKVSKYSIKQDHETN